MGLYRKYIFPYILDLSLSGYTIGQYRQAVLAACQGQVLEIGFGTGLNLSHYPKHIHKITTIDSNSSMPRWAQPRLDQTTIEVAQHILSAEKLPFPDSSFDTVVSTWTLCSIADVGQALQEVRRVLKPAGQMLFIEHGLSSDAEVVRWQHRLNPLQQIVGDGCQLNRNISGLISQAGLNILHLKNFYIPQFPRPFGYMYQGIATKA